MALHGGAGVITPPEGSIREAERIIRRAPLRKQFNRAPEVLDRRFLAPVRGGDPASTYLPDRLRLWIRDERAREPPALVDPAGFEKRVSEFHTRRYEVGIQGDGTLQLFRGLRVPGEPLQDHAVEIVPLVGSRRQRLRAPVGVVRGVPLLPCMEHACQLSRRLGIRRPRAGILDARRIISRAAGGNRSTAGADAVGADCHAAAGSARAAAHTPARTPIPTHRIAAARLPRMNTGAGA